MLTNNRKKAPRNRVPEDFLVGLNRDNVFDQVGVSWDKTETYHNYRFRLRERDAEKGTSSLRAGVRRLAHFIRGANIRQNKVEVQKGKLWKPQWICGGRKSVEPRWGKPWIVGQWGGKRPC